VTKARKNANALEAKGKPKQTAHRIAAAKPEVRALIALLRKRWKHANSEERRARVVDLLEKGCSIRGLADDIHQDASLVRYYSKPASASSTKGKPKAKGNPKAPQAAPPVKGSSKQMAAAPPKGEQGLAPSKSPSGGLGLPAAGSGKRPLRVLPPRPPKLDPKAMRDDQDTEKEKTLQSLRGRLAHVIIEFIRAKLGSPDSPATSD
jgi:hypothetical protein